MNVICLSYVCLHFAHIILFCILVLLGNGTFLVLIVFCLIHCTFRTLDWFGGFGRVTHMNGVGINSLITPIQCSFIISCL